MLPGVVVLIVQPSSHWSSSFIAACFAVALNLISTSGVAAQSTIVAADAAPPSQTNQPTTKAPPPPLFPKHRRGIYTNAAGVEVIDATPQSPPLDTDDPAVPDERQYEINFTTHADAATETSRIDLLTVDANYGLLATINRHVLPMQIKFECPLAAAREAGEPYNVGIGAATFGVKVKFYHDEHRGLSLAIYPQVEFAAPGGRGVDKGLSEQGQTLILPLLLAREFHDFTFVFNAALEKPAHDPGRQVATEFGAAIGRAFTRKVAAMIELRTESSANFKEDRLVFVNGGLIHGVRHIIVYMNLGHSLFADEGGSHTYAGVGMKVLIDTKKKATGG
jgi:hypothetical protein